MTWVFGEQYHENTELLSDKNLIHNLEKYRNKYLEYVEDEEYDNSNPIENKEVRLITDLFMFSERILDEKSREVLIVELKAPRVKISPKEIRQAMKYAGEIEDNGIFPKNLVYKILLVGNGFNKEVKREVKGRKTEITNPYLYWSNEDKNVEVLLMCWSDIFESLKRKFKYMSNELQVKDVSIKSKVEKDFSDLDFKKIKSKLVKEKR